MKKQIRMNQSHFQTEKCQRCRTAPVPHECAPFCIYFKLPAITICFSWIWTAPCPHSFCGWICGTRAGTRHNQTWMLIQSSGDSLNNPSNIWAKILGNWAPWSPSCEATLMSCFVSSFHHTRFLKCLFLFKWIRGYKYEWAMKSQYEKNTYI